MDHDKDDAGYMTVDENHLKGSSAPPAPHLRPSTENVFAMELDGKALDASNLVPRTWFLGGFVALVIFAIIQVSMIGALISNDHFHDDEVAASVAPLLSGNEEWASGSLGERPPGFEGKSWSQVLEEARDTTVTFAADARYMGQTADEAGFITEGNYVQFLKDMLRREFDITLNFINLPASNAVTRAGADGDIDFIWLNKGNYIALRNAKNSYGPWANLLPNARLFDFNDPVINSDFGIPTNGEEMPLHIANFVMAYDEDNVPPGVSTWPPRSIDDIFNYVINDQIKFHPMAPATFPGTPFMELFWYHYVGYENIPKFREEFDEDWYLSQKEKVFPKLKEFHDKLYVHEEADGTKTKYSAPGVVRSLFNNGTIHLTGEYSPGLVYNLVRGGTYPPNTVSFLLNEGMVSNTNFLTIPKSSPNKAGAFVAVNLASSLEHQYKRFIPNESSWNALQAYNPFNSIVRKTGYTTVFDEIEQLEGAPSLEAMAENRVPEMNEAYQKRWLADFNKEIGVGVDLLE